MTKTSLSLFFWLTTFAGMIIMMASIGWLLGLFGIGLVPCIILHIVSGTKALNRVPLLNPWIITSSFLFLVFALIRPDFDDKHAYTGFSVILNGFGFRPDRYVTSQDAYFVIALILLLGIMALDFILLRKSKRPPPIAVNNDFV
jgi:hypothetical protein